MKKEEYVLLYEKCVSGNCTEHEKKLLEEFKDEFSINELPWDETTLGNEQTVTDRMYKRLQQSIHENHKFRWMYWYKFSAAAAMAVIFLSIGLYFYLNSPVTQSKLVAKKDMKNDIAPGSNKALLTLADGSQIVLDNSSNGVLANQGNTVVRKEKDGQLVYDFSKSLSPNDKLHTVAYNSISTPRGGEYQLLLPDGTKVWLNAGSSLKFPVAFNGKQRKVELLGEAYFEVATNKKIPFTVITGQTEVEVLGTHFNVNAYQDISGVNTTLLEGSVRLKNGEKQTLLKPGQSGIYTSSGDFTLQEVDVEEAVAWKNGYFVFQDENIRSIMAKAARWYDVEVEYRGNMTDKNFWGKVSRYENISELLKNMELTGSIHFKIEGRRVIVMP